MTTHAAADFVRIGHRGAAAECPENTLASFRRAVEQSAGMIECDLQLTADGQVVVIHDWKVDRTTDGSGTVTEMSLDEIRKLDAGAWKGERFRGEPVPMLDEVLELLLPTTEINLELKCRGGADLAHRLAMTAIAAVSKYDALDKIVFSSFDQNTIEAVRDVSPYAQIGILWTVPPFDMAWELAEQLGAVAFHPESSTVDRTLVETAHQHGLTVNTWTVNETDRMVELARAGVDGIISDAPGRLLEAKAQLLAL